MKYKAIIFDWDGTLMDSVGKIVECIQASAVELELPVPSHSQAKDVIGISLVPALQKLFNIEDLETAQQVANRYKRYYAEHQQVCSPLFPDVIELLETLKDKGYLLAVATGKGRSGLHFAWQHTKTAHYFDTHRCADDAQSKPSPDMLKQILAEFNLTPEQALMVGDTSYDMAMAQAINMDRVAVTFGVHDHQTLSQYQPKALINSIQELLEFV